jgi:hypothetical protein
MVTSVLREQVQELVRRGAQLVGFAPAEAIRRAARAAPAA